MKFKILMAVAAMVAGSTYVSAQASNEPPVKILSTATPGVIKMLYAEETNEPVMVTFTANDQVVNKDKIRGEYPNGVSKRYDVSKISKRGEFWVEISSPRMTVTYRVVPSEDRTKFTPVLERTSYNQVWVSKK